MLLQRAKIPIFGVFENEGTFTCPDCGEKVDLVRSSGGEALVQRTAAPLLSGSIPLDSKVAECADQKIPIVFRGT